MSNNLLSLKEAFMWTSFITGMAIVAVGAGLTLAVDQIWILLEVAGWIIAIAIPLLIMKYSKKNAPDATPASPI